MGKLEAFDCPRPSDGFGSLEEEADAFLDSCETHLTQNTLDFDHVLKRRPLLNQHGEPVVKYWKMKMLTSTTLGCCKCSC